MGIKLVAFISFEQRLDSSHANGGQPEKTGANKG
jgi:hypothetical protein